VRVVDSSFELDTVQLGGEGVLQGIWASCGRLLFQVAPVFLCTGGIYLKPFQACRKQVEWKAYDGIVRMVDWSFELDIVQLGGEDAPYGIWAPSGRLHFQVAPVDHVVSWESSSPAGTSSECMCACV